jgi:hypothetical protein
MTFRALTSTIFRRCWDGEQEVREMYPWVRFAIRGPIKKTRKAHGWQGGPWSYIGAS